MAQASLGLLLIGRNVDNIVLNTSLQDSKEGTALLERAIASDSVLAHFGYGCHLFDHGERERAMRLVQFADDQGHARATPVLARLKAISSGGGGGGGGGGSRSVKIGINWKGVAKGLGGGLLGL
jgi:hypothetical protein